MKNYQIMRDATWLRQRAEELLKKKPSKTISQLSEAELLKLIYELEIHQVELELQNEELQLARSTTQAVAEKYMELYDFAPIGYLELSKEGSIVEINLCASQMLGKARSYLKNSKLGFFISDDTKPIFNHLLLNVFTSHTKETCEVILSTDYKFPIYASLTGIICRNEELCLVTAMDITNQKRAETILDKWAAIFKPKAN